MTQANSKRSSDRRAAIHRFKSSVKNELPLMAVLFMLGLIGWPAVYASPVFLRSEGLIADGMTVMIMLFFSALMCFVGAVAVSHKLFSYLFRKPDADMVFALPISRRALFLADFFAGLTVFIVPQILAHTAGIIGYFAARPTVTEATDDTPMGNAIRGIYSSAHDSILPVAVLSVMSFAMMYAVSVLAVTATGKRLTAAFITEGIAFLIPAAEVAVIHSAFSDIYGADSSLAYSHLIPYTSPYGAFFFAVINSLGYNELFPAASRFTVPLLICIVSAVYTLFAYILFRKRNAEQSGTNYASPVLLGAVTVPAAASGVFLAFDKDLTNTNTNILFVALALLVCVLFLAMSRNKKVTASFAAASAVVSLASFGTVRATEHFGADKAVPDVNAVAGADITWNDSASTYGIAPSSSDNGLLSGWIGFNVSGMPPEYYPTHTEAPDDIGVITEWHRYCTGNTLGETSVTPLITVKYTLRNGSVLVRTYSLDNTGRDILSKLDMSDAFREKRADSLAFLTGTVNMTMEEAGFKDVSESQQDIWSKCILSCAPTDVRRNIEAPVVTYNEDGSTNINADSTLNFESTDTYRVIDRSELPADFYERLNEELRKDIFAETSEQFYGGDDEYTLFLNGYFTPVRIPSHYRNTLSYLYEQGFENAREFILPSYEDVSEQIGRSFVRIANTAVDADMYSDTWKTLFYPYSLAVNAPDTNKLSYTDEQKQMIYELIKHSRTGARPEVGDYILTIGMYDYVIDDDAKDTAKELYIQALAGYSTYERPENGQEDRTYDYLQAARVLYPEAEEISEELGDN